jgi:hypothetical protein
VFAIAATVIIMIGYRSVPDANTCYPVNLWDKQAGLPPSCSTVPSAGYLVAAGLCLLAGFLILVPWWLRSLTAPSGGPSA